MSIYSEFPLNNVSIIKIEKYKKNRNFADSTRIDNIDFKVIHYSQPNRDFNYWSVLTQPDSLEINYDYILSFYDNDTQHKYHISDITYSVHQFGKNLVCQLDSLKINGKIVEDYLLLKRDHK